MRTRMLLAVLLLAGALTACGPSAPGPAPAPTATVGVEEQARRHARCMREHGIPESDPQPRPGGGTRLGGGFDKSAVDPQALADAVQACRAFDVVLPPAEQDGKLELSREYSRCMRANGVEDFPDPDAEGRVELPDEITDPEYDRAAQTCTEHIHTYTLPPTP